jgi:hypothetical protein
MPSHRLIVDQRLIEKDYRTAETDLKYSLFYQMTRITKDRDALCTMTGWMLWKVA